MIGDGDTMSVGSQVTEDLVGSTERGLAVDHPAVTEELAEKTAKDFGLRQGFELSVELELPAAKVCFNASTNLPRKTLPRTASGTKKLLRRGRTQRV